jgi:hypothetical protein
LLGSRRQIHQLQRTAEEDAIAAILGDSPQFSQVVPLTEENTKYIAKLKYLMRAKEEKF